MLSNLQSAGIFLVNTLFDLYLLVLMVRFILCWVRADYFNPITRFVVSCTQFIIFPLRRVLPTFGKVEYSTLVLMLILNSLKFFLIGLVYIGLPKNPLGLLILSSLDLIKLLLNVFFYAIFLQAVLSFVQPGFSPISLLLSQLTVPIMRPVQRIIPPVGGMDISPIPVLILLQLMMSFILNPLINIGTVLTFG